MTQSCSVTVQLAIGALMSVVVGSHANMNACEWVDSVSDSLPSTFVCRPSLEVQPDVIG